MAKQDEFNLLVKTLYLANHHFSLWKLINDNVQNDLFEKDKFLWETVLLGLEQSFLLGLSKFFERPKDLDDTISIYYFFDFGHNDLINKLKKVRNKMLSHHDKKIIHPSFLEELRMRREDIELLFKAAVASLGALKKEFGYTWHDEDIPSSLELDEVILRQQLLGLLTKLR